MSEQTNGVDVRALRRLADKATELLGQQGFRLDYSLASAARVDKLLDVFRDAGHTRETFGNALFGIGAYIGQLIVIHGGAVWVNTSDVGYDVTAFGSPFVLSLAAGGVICNPIGKVYKRFENGEEDSLELFVHIMVDAGQRAANNPPT